MCRVYNAQILNVTTVRTYKPPMSFINYWHFKASTLSTGLSAKNSAFFPQSAFVLSLTISEHSAIISQCNINWRFRFLLPCIVNIRWIERTNNMQLIRCLLSNFLSQHVSGTIMPIITVSYCMRCSAWVCRLWLAVVLWSCLVSCVHCVSPDDGHNGARNMLR
jgi:hypothetical protein